MKLNKNIAILAGGGSCEHDVSLKSAALVVQNMPINHIAFIIEINGSKWTYSNHGERYAIDKNEFTLTMGGDKIYFDLAFIVIHGSPGEDGKLQGYFDLIGLPYTSANVLASAIGFNKGICNDFLKYHNISVAKSIQLYKDTPYDAQHIIDCLKLPCFVKANQSGSSYGVHKVHSIDEMQPAIEDAFKYDTHVRVESFLSGKEVTCGVHNVMGKIETLPITEIITENDFFDFNAKYKGESQEITPADIPISLAEQVSQISKRIFTLLNLDGVARADFIIHTDKPYLIEINTVPGLSEASLIPQQIRASGSTLSHFFKNWITHSIGN